MSTNLKLSATYYPPRKEGYDGTVGFDIKDKTTHQSYFGQPNMNIHEFAILFPTVDLEKLIKDGYVDLQIKEFRIVV